MLKNPALSNKRLEKAGSFFLYYRAIQHNLVKIRVPSGKQASVGGRLTDERSASYPIRSYSCPEVNISGICSRVLPSQVTPPSPRTQMVLKAQSRMAQPAKAVFSQS